jgi:branched-chain amino acid transport system substrate-binding protein|tara:strand:+ start:3353 stop:4504 length:1152 start_codon:yes stop_codon:yes gene_type:complete
MKNMKLFRLTVILVFLFSITHFCFAETGVFPKNIVFVTHQPLSGPAKEYSDIGKSAQAYFKYVNDQGGVHGRSIELKIIDDQLKPYKAKEELEELTLKNDIFAVFSGIGSKTHQAVYPLLKEQRLPSFFVGSDLPEWTQPLRANVFGFMPTAETEARVIGKYITEKHTGKEFIIWYPENPVYQRSVKALTKELYNVSAKLLPGKAGRLNAEWQLIRRNNPDFLVVLGNYTDVMNFLKFSPQINIPMLTGHALADSRLTEWLGQKVSERVRVLTAYPLKIETEHPGQILHKLILSEYAPNLALNRWTLYGHAVAELMVEVLNRSGRSLSRQKAVSAAESITKWQGKLLPPVYLDSRNHLALTTFRVSRITYGRVSHLSGWIDGK